MAAKSGRALAGFISGEVCLSAVGDRGARGTSVLPVVLLPIGPPLLQELLLHRCIRVNTTSLCIVKSDLSFPIAKRLAGWCVCVCVCLPSGSVTQFKGPSSALLHPARFPLVLILNAFISVWKGSGGVIFRFNYFSC